MKKSFRIFAVPLAGALLLGFAACDKNANDAEKGGQIEVYPTSLTFNAGGGIKEISVTGASDWTASENADWLSTKKSGGKLIVTADANSIETEQTTTITIGNDSDSHEIAVTLAAGYGTPLVSARALYYGNRLGNGVGNFALVFGTCELNMSALAPAAPAGANGHMVELDILTRECYDYNNLEIADGTYTVGTSLAPFTIYPSPSRQGLTKIENGKIQMITRDLFVDGTATIEHDGADYTVKMDLKTDSGATWKASYSGPFDVMSIGPAGR